MIKNDIDLDEKLIEGYSMELRKLGENIEHFTLMAGQSNLANILRRQELEEQSRLRFGGEEKQGGRIEFSEGVLDGINCRKNLKKVLGERNRELGGLDWSIPPEKPEKLDLGGQQVGANIENKNLLEMVQRLELDFGYSIGKEF